MTTSILKAKIKPPTRYVKYIGVLTIVWAELEMRLDSLIVDAFVFHDSSIIGHNNMPHTLDRKIEFLKDAFNRLPPYSEFSAQALPLVRRVGALGTQRHELTHGVVTKHLWSGGVVLTSVKLNPKEPQAYERIVRVKQIEALIREIEALTSEFLELALAMEPPKKFLDKLLTIIEGDLPGAERFLRKHQRKTARIDQIEREGRQSRAKARRERSPKEPGK